MRTTKRPPIGGEKKILLSLLLIVCLLVATSCAETHIPNQKHVQTALVFNTMARLSAEGVEADAAVRDCIDRLNALDCLLVADTPDSPLARLAANAGNGEWIPLPPELWHVLSVSQRYSELTDGAWDVTVAPLALLFEKALVDKFPPTAEEIDTAHEKIGWQKLELREENKSARLVQAGMALDLGGVRKGFALDECRRIYATHHVTGLIDLGESSIAAIGGKDSGKPFRIALRHPREETPARLGVLALKDAVLSSSGDYEHFFLYDGVRYHHIIDPCTGRPAQSGIASVFILVSADETDAGLISDILSTAFFTMGEKKSLSLLPILPNRIEAAFANETNIIAQTSGFASSLMQ